MLQNILEGCWDELSLSYFIAEQDRGKYIFEPKSMLVDISIVQDWLEYLCMYIL